MSLQRAIQIQQLKVAKLVSDAPIPKLRDGYIRVKLVAVALNPTDWEHINFLASEGAIVVCDYSGIVEDVGPGVTNGLKVGDKVAGFVHAATAQTTKTVPSQSTSWPRPTCKSGFQTISPWKRLPLSALASPPSAKACISRSACLGPPLPPKRNCPFRSTAAALPGAHWLPSSPNCPASRS